MTNHRVRLVVRRIDIADITRPGEILLDIDEPIATLPGRARAWATEHGHDRLLPFLDKTFATQPPESGFALIINKPTQLMVLVAWPWCPQLHADHPQDAGQEQQPGDWWPQRSDPKWN